MDNVNKLAVISICFFAACLGVFFGMYIEKSINPSVTKIITDTIEIVKTDTLITTTIAELDFDDDLPLKVPSILKDAFLTKNSLFLVNTKDDTMAISRSFIEEINLYEKTICVNPHPEFKDSYCHSYSLVLFTQLMFAYKDILEKDYDNAEKLISDIESINHYEISNYTSGARISFILDNRFNA